MSQALEFAFPVSPTNLGSLNRNIRKFRILQYATDSEGLLPLVVGTYSVDLTTGQPIQTQIYQSPLPNNFNQITGAASNTTIIDMSAPFTRWVIYSLIVSASAATRVTLGGALSGNFLSVDIPAASTPEILTFPPYGLDTNNFLGVDGYSFGTFGNTVLKTTGGATVTGFVYYYAA